MHSSLYEAIIVIENGSYLLCLQTITWTDVSLIVVMEQILVQFDLMYNNFHSRKLN